MQHVWLAPGVGGAVGAAAARSPHLAGAPAAPPGSRAAAPGATARARTARAQRKCRPGRGRRTGQGLGRVRSVTPGRGRRTPSPQVREPRPARPQSTTPQRGCAAQLTGEGSGALRRWRTAMPPWRCPSACTRSRWQKRCACGSDLTILPIARQHSRQYTARAGPAVQRADLARP